MAKTPEFEIPAPRENPHLFGHEAAEARFMADHASGRLHHAYLITGPKGIGKATFAYRMTRNILAQGALSASAPVEEGPSLFGDLLPPAPPPAPEPTATMGADDPLFRRVAAGSHSDLLVLTPGYDAKKHVEKAHISIEDARKVPEFLSLTPAEGDWRVVVIDAVDQLNNASANALLKIMEEPPERALLLMVCHQPGAILPTIKSRCRQFALQPPTRQAFDQVLATIAPHIESHDYAALFALADGSPGLAVTLAQHGGVESYGGWLAALQPDASAQTKQRWADAGAAIKSPEQWAMLLHGWQVAMHRTSLWPHYDPHRSITRAEAGQLEAIATATPFALRQQWLASARQLLTVTDTFHLDKRHTLRLMLDPGRLTRQFPAAA
jgi:DNA polymerase-3 subunit delta'